MYSSHMRLPRQGILTDSPSEIFRRIYYRLYSNSDASRAETILANLSLVLLVFFDLSKNSMGREAIADFVRGATNSDSLLTACRKASPDLLDPGDAFSLSDPMLRDVFADMAGLEYSQAAHVMGDAFQSLMGPRLRGDRGQFFTPRALIKAIVDVAQPTSGMRIVDPACGTAGFLAEVLTYTEDHGLTDMQLEGVDKDPDLARLGRAVLQISASATAFQVRTGNSLDLSLWSESSFDQVLTNPPFGAKIGVDDPVLLAQYDLGHRAPKGRPPEAGVDDLLASQDPQILFLELSVRLLKDGGLLAIVLPEGMFGNRQTSHIWDWLRARGSIEALIDCPRTTFQPGTDTKTNVLFFRKGGPQASKIRVSVAKSCGHDRRGRTTLASGKAVDNDFAHVGTEYSKNMSKVWTNVALPSDAYFVPRYLSMKSRLDNLDFGLASDSRRATIGELVAEGLLSVTKGHEVGSEAYGTGDIPFVRTSDISNFEIRQDATNGLSEEIFREYSRLQNLVAGDILLVVDGRYRIGAAALVSEANSRIVVQSHIRILQSRDHMSLDPYGLLYALSLPAIREQMRDLIFIQSTLGTVAPRLTELVVPVIQPGDQAAPTVESFRSILTERDRLLAIISSQAGSEVEI